MDEEQARKEALTEAKELAGIKEKVYEPKKIHFVEGKFWDSWDKLKGHMKNKMQQGEFPVENIEKYDKGRQESLFFLAHSNDIISGKPQLVEQVMKRIPLVKEVRKIKNTDVGRIVSRKILMFDENYDKRYDGYENEVFAEDFYMYRIVENGKEFYVLTKELLPNEVCKLRGMLIEFSDHAEITRSMKLKSLSRIFILESFEPSVEILSKEELVKRCKEAGITKEVWMKHLAKHPIGTYNRFPEEAEELKSACILWGKTEGWTSHVGIMGNPGTKKTMGWVETTAYKFSDDPEIVEGADSRIKGLSPSFKEKPANIGYLAKCNRMGWVDEIGKMVEAEINKHQTNINNVLGELNFLLEHKLRVVGSGNDNDCKVQATAKFMFPTNPVGGRRTIGEHVGIIDPTTMSRMIWWVQDEEEQKFVFSEKGVVKC